MRTHLPPTVRSISACLLACATLPLAVGCPDDLATGSSSGGSTGNPPSTSGASTTTGSPTGADATGADATGVDATGADETGTTGDPPPPPPAMTLNCEDEYFQDFGSGHDQLDYDVVSEPTIVDLDIAVECPEVTATSLEVDVLVRRPSTDASAPSQPWPTAPVPWVVLSHGNQLSAEEYDHIVQPLVEKGFAVFLPDGIDVGADERADILECVAKWADAQYAAELGSCFAFAGHSNAGQGAFLAARSLHLNNDPMASRLGAVASLAPQGPDDELLGPFSEQTTPTLIVAGSRDDDIGKGGSTLYESASNEGAYNLASGLSGSLPGRTGEKVLVEAYDVSHSALGGVAGPFDFSDPLDFLTAQEMIDKGHAVAAAYVPAFLFWQLVGVDSYRARFADNEHPPELTVNTGWWNYLPQWSTELEEPLVFTAYQMGDKRGIGIQRFSVATLEGDDPDFPYAGEGMLDVGSPSPALVTSSGRQDLPTTPTPE